MKKIDKLIFSSFIGPFILTFVVVVFILLNVQMLKYYDDIMGKGLSTGTLAELFLYFAIFVTPTAFPLAVLLSSLMTFGALGEHFELTAIKSAGISLLRALVPIFIFVLFLCGVAFYSNNTLVPAAALEAYSLLYDIKQKKPALDIKEGIFYQGIPDFSIKVDEKLDDGQTLRDVIIYDHRDVSGNKKVTIAESGKMQMMLNDRYLKLELFNGNTYMEGATSTGARSKDETFLRSSFQRNQVVMDLSSFVLDRTDQNLFRGNRIMRNLSELTTDVDSMQRQKNRERVTLYQQRKGAFFYHDRNEEFNLPAELRRFKQKDDSLKATYQKPVVFDSLDRSEPGSPDSLIARNNDSVRRTPDSLRSLPDSIRTLPDSLRELPDSLRNLVDVKADTLVRQRKLTMRADTTLSRVNPERRLSENVPQLSYENQRRTVMNEAQKKQAERAVKSVFQSDSVPGPDAILSYVLGDSLSGTEISSALSLTRQTKMKLQGTITQIKKMEYEKDVFEIQWNKILSNALACLSMFLIGAPLGAIIKRGGLGIPVLISIVFFIIFYVISMQGEKWAKADLIEPWLGIWSANIVLFPVGLIFLRQARNDARLFDADFYNVWFDRLKTWWKRRKNKGSSNK